MKRLYQEWQWVNHSGRIAQKARRRFRRARKRHHGIALSSVSTRVPISVLRKRQPVTIAAPAVFSVIKNYDVIVDMFITVSGLLQNGQNVTLDMRDITELEPDGILYLLSQMHKYSQRTRFKGYIIGIPPNDKILGERLVASGFYDHVASGIPKDQKTVQNQQYLRVRSGSYVDPMLAKSVKTYARESLGGLETLFGQSLYATLIECMANSKNHAYKDKGKWWLIAQKDPANQRVRFVFLDNGRTIPVTVRKTIKEEAQHVLSMFFDIDADLIESTLNGSFRTRTKLVNRGKGLPKILAAARAGHIANLTVVSRQGLVVPLSGIKTALPVSFAGTMLAWDFVREDT